MEKVKIALLGLGTVGTGVWNILKNNGQEIEQRAGAKVEIAKVLVKDEHKARSVSVPEGIITTDFNDIIEDDEIKIIIEVIGGIEPAKEFIERAIEKGKHVVTANKLLISKHGNSIASLADAKGVALSFEASVCGGIPIINTIKESLNAEKIEEIVGIVNGTTNYILSKMSDTSCSFKDALKEAQEKGFAEADSTSDIEGYDALYKLRILTKLAYGADISESRIYREGISRITAEDITYAKELGYEIKLLAVAKSIGGALDVRVHPAMVPLTHSLARVGEAYNAVCLKGNAVGDLLFCGKGAGELPTGSAVVNDIVNIVKNNKSKASSSDGSSRNTVKNVLDIKYVKFPFYLRFVVRNRTGAMNKIINVLTENNIRIASMIRREQQSKYTTLTVLSHEALEYNIQNAVGKIKNLPEAIQIGNLIRVENFGSHVNELVQTTKQTKLYS